MALTYQVFSSPLGEILVAGSGFAVTRVLHGADRMLLAAEFRNANEDATPLDRSGYIRESCGVIADFLNGKSSRIDVTVQTDGSDFERRVWQELRLIPFGKTTTYVAVAKAIEAPNDVQKVADACVRNPVPLIIPCHRATPASEDLGGFIWGADARRFLLELELQKVPVADFAE